MERYLQKPQLKNEEEFMKQEYLEKTQQLYQIICDKLGDMQAEDLDILVEQIYKSAYIDGFKDAVYFNDI